MSANTATNLGMPSLVPPEFQALFGDPPLLRGEDIAVYNTLMDHFTKLIEPKDVIEWWWVKDITDHTWDIRRLRRFKVLIIELSRDGKVEHLERLATLTADEDAEYVPVPVPDSEKDSAELFMYRIGQYNSVDKLVASAELRRDRTLGEIHRRREQLAQRLRKATDEIIEGEFNEMPLAA